MASQGILYTVEGPRGSYYAIHDPATRRIWTERTEQAARAQAQDIGMVLVGEEIISHEELLRRTGREVPPTPATAQSEFKKPRVPSHPAPDRADVAGPALIIGPQIPHEETGDSLVLRHVGTGGSFFAVDPLLGSADLPEESPDLRLFSTFSTGEIIASAPAAIPTDDGSDLGTNSL